LQWPSYTDLQMLGCNASLSDSLIDVHLFVPFR